MLLARADGDPAEAWRAADRMATSLDDMGPEAGPEHRIMANYDLEKFWSGLGEHAALQVENPC